MNISSKEILDFFNLLNSYQINYVLLRNIDNELPFNFKGNKDIDILVHSDSKGDLYNMMREKGWKKLLHPLSNRDDYKFLYAMDEFDFFSNTKLNIDVCYQLACRSTNKGEWMPLDKKINSSVWENKQKDNKFHWYTMNTEDQLIHLLCRCIFDKKMFPVGYLNKINELYFIAKKKILYCKLELIFFKFTPYLIDHINNNDFADIIVKYLQFTKY